MTAFLLFLTVFGLACLVMLFCRRMKPGAALLTVSGALVCLTAAAGAAEEPLPGFLRASGWVLLALGMLGLLGGTVYAFLHRKRMPERLSAPAVLVFLLTGTVCALLGAGSVPTGGLFAPAEKMIALLGGQAVSFGLPVCAAACAALCGESRKPLPGLLMAPILIYAFGVFGLHIGDESAAAAALFIACAAGLYFGGTAESAAPLLFAPAALLLTGGAAGWIGAAMLFYAALRRRCLLRRRPEEKEDMSVLLSVSAVLCVLALLLKTCLGEGGLLAFPSRFAAAFTAFREKTAAVGANAKALGLAGFAPVKDGFSRLAFLVMVLGIPVLLSFFFTFRRDRALSLRAAGFFLTAAALGLIVPCVSALLNGAFPADFSVILPMTGLLCVTVFLVLAPAEDLRRGWLNVLCAAAVAAGLLLCFPPAERFAPADAAPAAEEEESPEAVSGTPVPATLAPVLTPAPTPVPTKAPAAVPTKTPAPVPTAAPTPVPTQAPALSPAVSPSPKLTPASHSNG